MANNAQKLLWFGVGFALAAILCLNLDAESHISVQVAFGLLCFASGAMLAQFLNLWKQQEEGKSEIAKSFTRWFEELKKLDEDRAKLDPDREALEAEKAEWEDSH
ncbi:MAG: hypothetical protein ACRD33_06365 [Candidatus Acidiferrales bacterium]